jgi:hypothetical protein
MGGGFGGNAPYSCGTGVKMSNGFGGWLHWSRLGNDEARVCRFRIIEFGLSFLGLDVEVQFWGREAEEVVFDGIVLVRVTILRPGEDFISRRGESLELAAMLEELIRLEGFEVTGKFFDGTSDGGAAFGVSGMEVRDGDVGNLGAGEGELFFSCARDFGGTAGAENLANAPMLTSGASFDGIDRDPESASEFMERDAGSGQGADAVPIDRESGFGHGSSRIAREWVGAEAKEWCSCVLG